MSVSENLSESRDAALKTKGWRLAPYYRERTSLIRRWKMFQIWTRRVNLATGYMCVQGATKTDNHMEFRGILSFSMWLDAALGWWEARRKKKECLRYAPFPNLPQSAVERKEKN